MRLGWFGAFLGLIPVSTFAMCTCECVDGAMQALCEDSEKVAPVCPARDCPTALPSSPPAPMAPPTGATACRSVQMLNPLSEQYEWRQICQ